MSPSTPRRAKSVTRKQFMTGMGGAAFGGVLVGGAGGYLGGRSSDEEGGGGGGNAPAKGEAIVVGAGVPVTGALSGDGQEMLRGLRIGAAEINRNGGVGGRPVQLKVLDTKEQQPEIMQNVMRKFVADRVAAIFAPFLTYTNVELTTPGRAGVPFFHVNTYQGNLDFVKSKGFTNIYQGCPSQLWYGPGFIVLMEDLIKSGKFDPAKRTVAIVTANDPYSLSIAKAFRQGIEKRGWRTVQFDTYSQPQTEWGGVMVRIRKQEPGVVFQSDYFPGDEASFIKQFAQSPTKSLVYQQYAPSVPEYLELARDAANGVIWSTVIGSIFADEYGRRFVNAYRSEYDQEPGLSNAGGQYDLIRLWAQAAALGGDPYDYEQVNANLMRMTFRGVSGAYKFAAGIQAPEPYPDKVKDPTLGMPHLTYQIQGGEHVVISPDPWTTGSFEPPTWLT